jgi:hypothetical protein
MEIMELFLAIPIVVARVGGLGIMNCQENGMEPVVL